MSYRDFLTPEQTIHKNIIAWLRQEHSDKMFLHIPNEKDRTDYEKYLFGIMGGMKGASDILLFEETEEYNGLAAEIKVSNPYFKNGKCRFPEQLLFLEKLRKRGWKAEFTVGYKNTKQLFQEYINLVL